MHRELINTLLDLSRSVTPLTQGIKLLSKFLPFRFDFLDPGFTLLNRLRAVILV
jgi:hypothetical protein